MRLADYPFILVRFRRDICKRAGQSKLAYYLLHHPLMVFEWTPTPNPSPQGGGEPAEFAAHSSLSHLPLGGFGATGNALAYGVKEE